MACPKYIENEADAGGEDVKLPLPDAKQKQIRAE
jgi:hypothetical protein